MRSSVWLLLMPAFVGCSETHDLEARRAQQAELAAEVATLTEDLDAVQTDVDVVSGADALRRPDPAAKPPRGTRRDPVGNPRPRNALGDAFRVRVERTGIPAPLPALDAPKRGEGACGWVFEVPRLRPISDLVLRNSGMGRSSPISLVEAGKPMTAHADAPDVADRCVGAFRHAGAVIQFSPSGRSQAATERKYRLAYDPALPLPRSDDGRGLYWVFPGTQLEFRLPDTWDPAWGEPTLTLAAKLIGEHTGRPLLELHDEPQLLDGDVPVVEQQLRSIDLDGRWAMRLSSPVDGPWVVVDTLTIGNAEHARVVTAEKAGDN